MSPQLLSDLAVLHLVVTHGSFTAAARELGVTQSALSQRMKRLEGDLGLRLLWRTTRSLAPTPAGQRLLDGLDPAIRELDGVLDDLRESGDEPRGSLRLTCGKHAADTLVWPAISRLAKDYPRVEIELRVENRYVDIVAERFDVGVRLFEKLEMDMFSTAVGPPLRVAVAASPEYLAEHSAPLEPRDLSGHTCIGFRNSTGALSPWTLEKEGFGTLPRISPTLVVNDGDALVRAACDGLGLIYVLEDLVAPHLATGRLVRLLDDWCEPFSGYHAYCSSRLHRTRPFSLLLDELRAEGRPPRGLVDS